MTTVGENLKYWRKEEGFSQQRLADESGIDRVTINKIERGKRSPTVTTLLALAKGLGIAPHVFLLGVR